MANRPQRILQVVEQSEAKNKIKSAQLQDHLFLDVALFEQDMREPAPRFGHVFSSRVEPANVQRAIRKRLRKKSGAAACIHCIRKPYPGLQPSLRRALESCHAPRSVGDTPSDRTASNAW